MAAPLSHILTGGVPDIVNAVQEHPFCARARRFLFIRTACGGKSSALIPHCVARPSVEVQLKLSGLLGCPIRCASCFCS